LLDAIGAGVVGGEGERQVVVVQQQQLFQVARAGVDIFRGIENVFHAEAVGGFGEQLHQPAGVFARDGFGIEIGLDGNHAADEVGVHAVFRGGGAYDFRVRRDGRLQARRRRGNGLEDVLGLDAHDVGDGDFDPAASHLQAVFVAEKLVAGDVEAFAAAQDDVFGAGGGGGEEEQESGGD